VDSMSFPVDQQARVLTVPDSYMTDGATSVTFAANALSGPGTLIVRLKDPAAVPSGPGGLSPVMVYDFELQGTSLLTQAQMTLAYPANLDGTLIGSNGSPANLAPYRLEAINWTLLAPKQLNTTLHTVTFPTPHFSQYALFVSGATAASDLRPRQRVLTPNGDGINDTIDFSGIGASASVHIYDIKGRRIRTLSSPTLSWDGRDDGGGIVESGLYLYQFTALGERVSGLILVAK
jgi:gliding motility-associated-like protein